jgi:uncharacterized phage-associated protein
MATVKDIAKCFLFIDDQNQGSGISNLKLQKLVYYAQGFFSAIYDKKLFDEDIEAWQHGPVVPELYHHFKAHSRNPIPFTEDFDTTKIGEDELELINEVYDVFGPYEAWKLRNMTHEETPWIDNEKLASVIPFDEIKTYFKTRVD